MRSGVPGTHGDAALADRLTTLMLSVTLRLRLMRLGCRELASNWVRLTPNGTHLGLFEDQFQYILHPNLVRLVLNVPNLGLFKISFSTLWL